MCTYSTRTEAIQREIVEPLGEFANDHDVEAIANEVLGGHAEGYALKVDSGTFWTIAENHAK